MNEKRKLQFEIIEKVEPLVAQWSEDQDIKLDRIEVIVPFVESEFDLQVVFFLPTDSLLETYRQDRTIHNLEKKYLSCLKEHDYPQEWLERVTFEFDSKENVDRNYEGNYFYRMR